MTRRPTPITATSEATGEVISYRSLAHAAQEGGFCSATITLCIRGIIPSHAGFKFEATVPLEPPRRPERAAKVKALRATGMSYAKIGKALGISESTAYYHARSTA
ncbi:MAG: helix-turn-helix domain-containing protein [Aeromonas hydrophila]